MKNTLQPVSSFLAVVLVFSMVSPSCLAEEDDPDPEYTRVINERACKIVDQLGIEDTEQFETVQQLIAGHYRGLSTIHDARDAEVAILRDLGGDEETRNKAIDAVKRDAEILVFKLHRQFVANLSVRLSPKQIEGVKNGLTYGVVPNTYGRYLQLLPELKDEERKQVKAWLIEAREYAMDGGSSHEKHGWFRKYKGRINNYFSERGYDIKAAEERLKQ